MSNILRSAEERDLESLLAMIRSYFAYDHIPFDEAAIRHSLPDLLQDHKIGRAWFIQVEGNAVGYLIATYGYDLEFGGPQATITDFFISPDYRRTGLGTMALQAVESELLKGGARAIELQVETDNLEALALYTKAGFRPFDRIPMSKRLVK